MTAPGMGSPGRHPTAGASNAASPGTVAGVGPCAPAREQVDSRCAEAERLSAAAQMHQQALRDARRDHADVMRLRDADAAVRDRRRMNQQKNEAQADYRAQMQRATDQVTVQAAAAAFLRRLDELNRQSRVADGRADAIAQRAAQLEHELPRLELAADAARIAAEAAQVSCLDARRTLAACEEETQRAATPPAWVASSTPGAANANAPATAPGGNGAAPRTGDVVTAPSGSVPDVAASKTAAEDRAGVANAGRALMRGDRQTLLTLALRLADETGFEAGRLQLLLLELREQIAARAREDVELTFPTEHPFWSQFPADVARNIAAALAAMGYRFDGFDGWVDSRVPQAPELALALAHCGFDPRTLRRPAGQAAIDALWRGTVVRSEEYLLAHAPELTLAQIVTLLGPRSGKLAELWDMWGRLRPLLMRAT